jgi:hypothetical protein
MGRQRVALPGLIPAGFQAFTTNSTAQSLNSTVRLAHVIDICCTQNTRYRADGEVPAATTGVILYANTRYRLEGFNGTSNLKFISALSTVSIVSVQGWRVEA